MFTTPLLERLIKLARKHRLDHPRGRALVCLADHYNGRMGHWRNEERHEDRDLGRMLRVQPETAVRWEAHVDAGGSPKHLCYTRAEWAAILRQNQERKRQWAERWARQQNEESS